MREGFTQIPNIVYNIGLKPADIAILCNLMSHNPNFPLTRYKVCKELKIHEDTLKGALVRIFKALKEAKINIESLELQLKKITSNFTLKNEDSQEDIPLNLRVPTLINKVSDTLKNKGTITLKNKGIEYYKNTNKNNIENINTKVVKKVTLEEQILELKEVIEKNKDKYIKKSGGEDNLNTHIEYFVNYLPNAPKPYKYIVPAFNNAIIGNWAKVNKNSVKEKEDVLTFKEKDELNRKNDINTIFNKHIKGEENESKQENNSITDGFSEVQ